MAITKLKQHDKCTVALHMCKKDSAHYAALRCSSHNTHIQWVGRKDFVTLRSIGVDLVERKGKHYE